MELIHEKTVEDIRGKILFFKINKTKLNFVEIKKGFARGGHYHEFESNHMLLSGSIKYLEKNIETGIEQIKLLQAPFILQTPSMRAHLLIALEDCLFVEVFEKDYQATIFPEYRKIVEEKMKNNTVDLK